MKYLGFIITALPAIINLSSCSNIPQDENKFNKTYKAGSIPNLNDFNTYTEIEMSMDSINRARDFRNNRSRLFIKSYTNGKLDSNDFSRHESLAMPCECFAGNDTLYVQMDIGFFGGEGFAIKIFDDNFQSIYFVWTDDVKPYKSNLADTAFTDSPTVMSKFQSLTIDDKPTFKAGQQLTGLLTLTSNNYYQKMYGDDIDSTYVSGKIYFICKTKQLKKIK